MRVQIELLAVTRGWRGSRLLKSKDPHMAAGGGGPAQAEP